MTSGDEEAPSKLTAPAPKPAMSRFLRTAGSDSSDSESEESTDTDSEAGPEGDGDETDDEGERPGVRIMSAQEKRLKEMEATGKVMDNALKINDWVAISTGEFLKIIFGIWG
jgi:translation initiation factor 3 subunit C